MFLAREQVGSSAITDCALKIERGIGRKFGYAI